MAIDFTPTMKGYTGQGAFRFWCQTVLPLVYDDSLSYYELLNKVVNYLNNTIADVANVEENVDALLNAYNQLQQYVNDYFDNLDVQNEINEKLDEMATSGELSGLVSPFIPNAVERWLEDNVTPTTPIVDKSLNISDAAADSLVTGNYAKKLREYPLSMNGAKYSVTWSVGSYDGSGAQWNSVLNRMRTNRFKLTNKTVVICNSDSYKISIFKYRTATGIGSGNFIGFETFNYPVNMFVIDPYSDDNGEYLAVVCARTDDSPITDSDLANADNVVNIFQVTDKNFSESGVPADSKALGDVLNLSLVFRRQINANENLDDVVETGHYYIDPPNGSTVVNKPSGTSNYARLVVICGTGGTIGVQIYFDVGGTPQKSFVRMKQSATTSWGSWERVGETDNNMSFRREIVNGDNIDNIIQTGYYYKLASVPVVNGPATSAISNNRCRLVVFGTGGQTVFNLVQIWFDIQHNTIYTRTRWDGNYTWTPWKAIVQDDEFYPGSVFYRTSEVYSRLSAIESKYNTSTTKILTHESISDVLDTPINNETNDDVKMRKYVLNVRPRHMAQSTYVSVNRPYYKKPKALIVGVVHGNERGGANYICDFIERLLSDPNYYDIAVKYEWHFVPVFNVWGYNHTILDNGGNVYWGGDNFPTDFTVVENNPIAENVNERYYGGIRYIPADKNTPTVNMIDPNRDFSDDTYYYDGVKYGFQLVESNSLKNLLVSEHYKFFCDIHQAHTSPTSYQMGFATFPNIEASENIKYIKGWNAIESAGINAEQFIKKTNYNTAPNYQFTYCWGDPNNVTNLVQGIRNYVAGYSRSYTYTDPETSESITKTIGNTSADYQKTFWAFLLETSTTATLIANSTDYWNRIEMIWGNKYTQNIIKETSKIASTDDGIYTLPPEPVQ